MAEDEKSNFKTNVFTDEGRLLQPEYAIKNVNKAGTTMGIVCSDGVVLIGVNLTKSICREKIYKLDQNTFCAVSGMFGDANRLIKHIRAVSAHFFCKYDKYLSLFNLVKNISIKKQKYTQKESSRPFGVSILYSGYDDETNKYLLYSTDPSGTITGWTAHAIGRDSDAIRSEFKNTIPDEPQSMSEGTFSLLQSFTKAKECNSEIVEHIEILHFNRGSVKFLSQDEVKEMMVGRGLITQV